MAARISVHFQLSTSVFTAPVVQNLPIHWCQKKLMPVTWKGFPAASTIWFPETLRAPLVCAIPAWLVVAKTPIATEAATAKEANLEMAEVAIGGFFMSEYNTAKSPKMRVIPGWYRLVFLLVDPPEASLIPSICGVFLCWWGRMAIRPHNNWRNPTTVETSTAEKPPSGGEGPHRFLPNKKAPPIRKALPR